MDIKVQSEKGRIICHGCLSGDRKICFVSKETSDLFHILRNDKFTDRHIRLELCWECVALLTKVKIFQARIKTAQCLLMDYLQCNMDGILNLVNLSSLSVTHLKTWNMFNDNDKRKEIVDGDEKKDITTEDLFSDIKIEDSNIKEEYLDDYDNYNDSDYCATENNVEKAELAKKSKCNYTKTVKRYKGYAIVTRRYEVSPKTYMKFAEAVVLDNLEYENVLKQDQKQYKYRRLPFKCAECKEGYIQELDLQRHQSICHGDKLTFPYKCAACRTKVTSLDHMDEHWSEAHSKLYKCTICSEIHHDTKLIKKHIKMKHHRTYTCKECGYVCSRLDEFRIHYRVTHETVICDYCNKKFLEKDRLVKHMRCVHLPAYCGICNRMYRNQKKLNIHNLTTHPELISVSAPKELSYCVECDRQFPTVFKFKKHLKDSVKHTKPKKERVPCPDCGKVFSRKNFMNNHYKFAHLKVTKNYCEQCDKYFTTGYGLRQHIDRVHKKIALPKDKMCDICGRGFAINKVLINHRRTHTGERPFQCMFCPAAFAQKTAMTSHQKSQHKNLDLTCSNFGSRIATNIVTGI